MLVYKQDQQKAKKNTRGKKRIILCFVVNIQKTGEYQTTITITKQDLCLMTSKEKKN